MIIKNNELRNSLEQNGYGTFQLVGSSLLPELSKLFEKFRNQVTFHNNVAITVTEKDVALKKQIHHEIGKRIELNNFFENTQIALAHFFVKRPGADKIEVHQDPMITDQAVTKSYGLWIPLSSNYQDGKLMVLAKSHHWFSTLQSEYFKPEFYNHYDFLLDQMKEVTLGPGEAVLMDNRLLHCSLPNNGNEDRIAIVIKFTEKGAPLYISHASNEKIKILEQKPEFYLEATWVNNFEKVPSGKLVRIVDHSPTLLSKSALLERMNTNKFAQQSIFEIGRRPSFLEFLRHRLG